MIICLKIIFFLTLIQGNIQAKEKNISIILGSSIGYGNVTKFWSYSQPTANGINAQFYSGIKFSRSISLLLEYEIHRIDDDKPKISDWIPGEYSYVKNVFPKVFRTDYFLLSPQLYLDYGIYIRPSLGFTRHYSVGYSFLSYPGPPSNASVDGVTGYAYGISTGIMQKLYKHLFFKGEIFIRKGHIEGSRRVWGIRGGVLIDFN